MNQAVDFMALGINRSLIEKLKKMDITVPTLVQAKTIGAVLAGRDLIVQSPTGTGKTLAYLAPLLERINPDTKDLEVLILVPSRELAVQIMKLLKGLTDIQAASIIGGTNPIRQLEALKEKPRIAVGTPGRVLELFRKRKINGQAIRTIVVDEADKMLTQGYLDDIKAILKSTLKTRQTLFFSATIPREILADSAGLLQNPLLIQMKEEGRVPATITHLYYMCSKPHRTQTLVKLLRYYKPQRAIVFIQRNEGVGPLAGSLQEQGIAAGALHSDLPQQLRKEVLNNFRSSKIAVLVTTDLLARGMDIDAVDYIFNYDLPLDEEFYLHRVGRTGRGTNLGTAITLVDEEKKFVIDKFARYLRIDLVQMGFDGDRVFAVKRKREGS